MPRIFSARTLVLGGLAIAAYGAMKNKRAISGLLGGGGQEAPTGYTPPAPAPPVANVDVAGPPANTATHVPAPEPVVHEPGGGIDEAAEEAAAAAEAANIGGTPEEYPDLDDPSLPADEAMRPLEEAGEGSSEGLELAEADLIDNAEPSAGDPIEGGRQIEDVISEQDDLFAGEQLEGSPAGTTEPAPTEAFDPPAPTETFTAPAPPSGIDAPPPAGAPATDVPPPPEDAPAAAAPTPSGTAMPEEATPAGETPAEKKSSAVWRIEDQPTVEADAVDETPEDGS